MPKIQHPTQEDLDRTARMGEVLAEVKEAAKAQFLQMIDETDVTADVVALPSPAAVAHEATAHWDDARCRLIAESLFARGMLDAGSDWMREKLGIAVIVLLNELRQVQQTWIDQYVTHRINRTHGRASSARIEAWEREATVQFRNQYPTILDLLNMEIHGREYWRAVRQHQPVAVETQEQV